MDIIMLNESKQGHFYSHWTNINGLIGILQSNSLMGSNDGVHHLKDKTNVSLSRLGNGSGIPNFVKQDGTVASVRIVLDIDKLEQRYKISPIEFYNDPKDRSVPSQRSIDDSEYEEAVVVGNTQMSAEIRNASGEFLGTIVIDLRKKKIAKLLDSEGEKVKISKDNQCELEGEEVSIKLNYTSRGIFYGVSLTGKNLNISLDTSDFIEYQKGAIKDIKSYITRVELADILFDDKKNYLVKSDTGDFLDKNEYINQVLLDKYTSGLNGDNNQYRVNHNYLTFDKFLNFIEKELGRSKIRTYESPKSFYSIKGDSSKGEYTVISNSESDNELYLVQLKFDVAKPDPYEYRLVPAISEKKAISAVKDCYSFGSDKLEEVKIIPFNRIRYIENNKYQFIGLPVLLKLMNKKTKNCRSYFEFVKTIVDLGLEKKIDIKVVVNYGSDKLSHKIKVNKNTLEIKIK